MAMILKWLCAIMPHESSIDICYSHQEVLVNLQIPRILRKVRCAMQRCPTTAVALVDLCTHIEQVVHLGFHHLKMRLNYPISIISRSARSMQKEG